MPLQHRIDLFLHVVQESSPLFGLSRANILLVIFGVLSLGLEPVHFFILIIRIVKHSARDLAKQVLEDALRTASRLGVIDDAFQALDFRLSSLVRNLPKHRMKEINTTESSGDNGVETTPNILYLYRSVSANVGKDLLLSQFDQA